MAQHRWVEHSRSKTKGETICWNVRRGPLILVFQPALNEAHGGDG